MINLHQTGTKKAKIKFKKRKVFSAGWLFKMNILLLAKSTNASMIRIQNKNERLKLVIKFDLNKTFNELKNLYDLPENSVELSKEKTTEQFKRKQIVLQSVERRYIPKWEITTDIEEAIKRLNQDKQQIIQSQVRNAIRHKMEDSEKLTPQSLLELYNKQEHEHKKIEKKSAQKLILKVFLDFHTQIICTLSQFFKK